mmetsp:Transcript_8293/g.8451  ORF Transcript_8293/g.8451 Transcript_8293/m.8451 type:complete len:204 (-) Transcript_8293:248-859(-)
MNNTTKSNGEKSGRVETISDWFEEYGGRSGQGTRQKLAGDSPFMAARLQKMNEQRIVSKRMHETLERLNNDSDIARKNVKAAIAVARQPGYFEYHQAPPDIVEKAKILPQYTRNISKLHNEITQIDAEMAREQDSQQGFDTKLPEISLNSLSQWFDNYGRPKHSEIDGWVTSFQTNPKVYGGTGHHRAFRSQASSMKKGRITR